MSNGAAAVFGVAANDVCATAAEDRARRLEPEYARLREVAKGHWTGDRYDRERPFAETARLIRKELAAAAKTDGVLRGVKCTVKSGHSTYKRAVDIKIVEVPTGDKMPIMSPRRVEREMRNPHAAALGGWLSKRGRAIEVAVEAIARRYSYCKSDSMSDYSDTAFHISVTFASDVQEAHRAEIQSAVKMARGE